MKVSEITVYPVKSLGGISLDESVVEKRGFKNDRRFMLTAENGEFFTQREFPKMATLSIEINENSLEISDLKNEKIEVPFDFEKLKMQKVRVWQSVCEAFVLPENINEWLSDYLETKCRIVYMPDESEREINEKFRQDNEIVSFADGYPFLIIGENSLNDLNEKLETKLPMNRFRPNLVVSGSEVFAEDRWKKIRIGETVFRATKPCARCVITTIEQSVGKFNGKEPLKTLAKYRMAKDVFPDDFESLDLNANSVLFGQNLVAENYGGKIKVGDEVKILA
ncbi:MOSC domain-containing protein [soil metagenome]